MQSRNGSPRARRVFMMVTSLVAIVRSVVAVAAPVYPVKASPNGRYLVDENGAPYMIVGESPQAMMVNISEAEAEMFFGNRSSYGFNTVWINLLCATYTGGRPDGSTIDGILPFTATIPSTSSYDLNTPNEAYFAHVDRIIALAAERGIQVLLDPCETGSWLSVMLDNGSAKCRDYGRYLGNRYESFDNIVWMSGNDFQGWRDPANDEVVRAVALGILDNDTRHMHTIELDYLVSSSLDDTTWAGIVDLNATYTYFPTYARLQQDYNRPNFLPTFMVEANYEFESLQGPVTTAPILRKQEYWTMTSGTTGQLYGNGYTWPFLNGWQSALDTPGAIQMRYLKTFFEPRAWYSLVPDTNHVVVTSGYGTYSSTGYVADNDYQTAARTPDGKLVITYTPVVRSFTIDMSKLSGPAVTRWFDPSSGAYVAIAGSPFPNAGTRSFTPPGNNSDGDGGWVLVLETEPPETQPPVVTLTSPAQGQIVSDDVPVAATASDNVGVAGVQFQIDGTNLGWEDLSPPYSTAWNTLSTANGAHVVKAIARDIAGNLDTDSVSVVVDNPIPPVPFDQLAAAYAFNESGGSTTADSSGNGNAATLTGASFGPGKNGNALAFDGTNDYAQAPNSTSLNISGSGITIAFWVKVNSTNSGIDYVLVGKPWHATTMTYPFYQYGVEYSNSSNKTLDFFFGDPAGTLHGPHRMSVTPGVWAHAAFTYDGAVVKGYVNGTEALSVPESGTLVPRGHSLRFGVDGAYQQFYNGSLDDVRIYARALNPQEISSVMLTPVGSSPPTVVDDASALLSLSISPNVPNPFREVTRIAFSIPAAASVDLRIFDSSGRLVRTLEQRTVSAGRYTVEWDGADFAGRAAASGRYFARLRAGVTERTLPLVLLR